MQYSVSARTDVGRQRQNNQDAFLTDEALGLFLVADGMGGHAGGEVASRMACDRILAQLRAGEALVARCRGAQDRDLLEQVRVLVEEAVLGACTEIYERGQADSALSGMGTTCSLFLLLGDRRGLIAHVGDSRLLVCRRGAVHQLTEDHTFVNELIRRGLLAPEKAKGHPQSHYLARALGVAPAVEVDTMFVDIDPGDTFLICSDGLHNYFPSPDDLAGDLTGDDLDAGVHALVGAALELGGKDNITAVAIRFQGARADAQVAARERIAVLKNIPLFSHLSYRELVKVVGLARTRRLAAEEVFIEEGQRGQELFVILNGQVEVFKDGRALTQLGAGGHLGEMTLVDGQPRSASARAVHETMALVLDREDFFRLIRREPVIASKLLWSFIEELSGRLRQTTAALVDARSQVGASSALDVLRDSLHERSL